MSDTTMTDRELKLRAAIALCESVITGDGIKGVVAYNTNHYADASATADAIVKARERLQKAIDEYNASEPPAADTPVNSPRRRREMRKTRTFEQTYNAFEVGTLVRPSSPRCSLPTDVYRVISMHPPLYAGDEAICFVEGVATGVSTEYLMEVKE